MNLAVPTRLTLARGFTLTEMAVVLVIVALLIAGMMMPLSTQMDLRNMTDTEKSLAEIRETLLGYAATHTAVDGKPFLPCPDTDDDGAENRAAGVCTSQEGRIPWVDLGLGRLDAWNNRYRYRVTALFSNSNTGFQLTSAGNMTICADNACATTISTNVPAVIVSHGRNGAGAFNMSGGINAAPTGADELENTDSDNTFVSKTPEPAFDDLVVWLPTSLLANRMVAAGKLP